MEKDNLKKTLGGFGANISNLFRNICDNLTHKANKMDNFSNFRSRIISGATMLVVGVVAIYFSEDLFLLVLLALTILMAFEWLDITKTAPEEQKSKWNISGFFYILLPMFSAFKIRDNNPDILLWMFAIIVATDTFAYFAGKSFGGAKLAPTISPNKTWSGLAGGVVASMVIGFLSSFMFAGGIVFFILISAILSVLEQVSDLLESKIKRIFGVKDSGSIIPGHGGILDRFDGMVLVAPVVLMLVWLCSENFIPQ
ncbi:MAG: phosphatidate cytidylyltransferase [Rickettsiales bacterium]|jgi:phosphatidate cytidylyltransferase